MPNVHTCSRREDFNCTDFAMAFLDRLDVATVRSSTDPRMSLLNLIEVISRLWYLPPAKGVLCHSRSESLKVCPGSSSARRAFLFFGALMKASGFRKSQETETVISTTDQVIHLSLSFLDSCPRFRWDPGHTGDGGDELKRRTRAEVSMWGLEFQDPGKSNVHFDELYDRNRFASQRTLVARRPRYA